MEQNTKAAALLEQILPQGVSSPHLKDVVAILQILRLLLGLKGYGLERGEIWRQVADEARCVAENHGCRFVPDRNL